MVGALSGFVSVAGGAFGAHALKQKLPPDLLTIFEVGVRYQMYHALALLAVGLLAARRESRVLGASGVLFVAGTVLFSGSLYALSLSGATWLGAITPFGGVAFLTAWGCLLAAVRRA